MTGIFDLIVEARALWENNNTASAQDFDIDSGPLLELERQIAKHPVKSLDELAAKADFLEFVLVKQAHTNFAGDLDELAIEDMGYAALARDLRSILPSLGGVS